MSYESPINIIHGIINSKFENEVLTVIHNLGIDVNKEELVRALQYDRGQYQKGYEDRDKEIVRCKDCEYYKDGFCYNPNTYDDEKTRGNTVSNWFCADGTPRS